MTALTARVDGKMRLWPVPADRLEELRDRTEIYRQFRKARARLIKEQRKRQREMLRVIDAIAKARTRQP
jgi:predicted Zn-dependent protease